MQNREERDLYTCEKSRLDENLMEAVELGENEKVQVFNNTDGAVLETYAIAGGSGVICLTGAAARRAQPGDVVIIIAYASVENDMAQEFTPAVAVHDRQNCIQQMLSSEPASTTLE
ncbi:aspartate 1-decarboxylase [Marinococcus halophilus]|uniref:aspartate 1-decarboxylase n=1 Tax=Marinococcus halophilus TaxID=1371 RepID=UPI003530B46E